MRLEKYKVNSENRYIILEESNGDFYTAKDFKKLIFDLENNMFKYDFSTKSIVFGLYKEHLVFSKEYNTIEELKHDYLQELIWNWNAINYIIH